MCKWQLWHNNNKKCLLNAQANRLFQSISGPKAMNMNFQSVKCLDKLVEHYGGRKSGVEKGFERMSIPAAWRWFCGSDCTAHPYLKVASPTLKTQSSSKLRQFRNRQAEFPDTLLLLTSISIEWKIYIVKNAGKSCPALIFNLSCLQMTILHIKNQFRVMA